jgi:ATP-binding cassette subfamily B protein
MGDVGHDTAHQSTDESLSIVIHVMHEGRVVESGTHAGLVALGGRYAASWRAQMREAGASVSVGTG